MTPPSADAPPEISALPEPRPAITLLRLVSELGASGASDRDVVACVMDLLRTGRVRLVGQVCDADLLVR